MSVLVLGDDPVTYCRCAAEYVYGLQDWFAFVEMNAWERVNAYYESARPKEIFLVVGQYMTSSYADAHKKYGSLECEVTLESSIQLPCVIERNISANLGIKKAYAEDGFEYVFTKSGEESPNMYSIILDTYKSKSGPLQRLKCSLATRVEQQYQYIRTGDMTDTRYFMRRNRNTNLIVQNTRSRFIKMKESPNRPSILSLQMEA